jgi:hypothetical protein
MSVALVGSFTLGEVNVAAAGALAVLNPLLGEFDLAVTLGLGGAIGDLSAQLSAALSVQAQVALQVSNPIAALEASLQAAVRLVAEISASLALGLPTIAIQASASVSIAAALTAKLGGLQLLIDAALAVKFPAVNLAASLAAHLSAGPVILLSIGAVGPDTLASAGTALGALFHAGVGGVQPADSVYGVVLLTKAPSVWASLQATIRAS